MYQVYVDGLPVDVAQPSREAYELFKSVRRYHGDVYTANTETTEVVSWTIASVGHFFMLETLSGAKYGFTYYKCYLGKLMELTEIGEMPNV